METVTSVLKSVRRGDWLFSLFLQDMYFPLPVHWESRPCLPTFALRIVYQFEALCFGLSMALQVLTIVFALVLDWALRLGMHLLYYLDD